MEEFFNNYALYYPGTNFSPQGKAYLVVFKTSQADQIACRLEHGGPVIVGDQRDGTRGSGMAVQEYQRVGSRQQILRQRAQPADAQDAVGAKAEERLKMLFFLFNLFLITV